jgi:hypothetical protein
MNRLVLVVALAVAGCVPEEGPLMRPGEDCMRCHGANEDEAKTWSIAGTVYDAPDADAQAGLLGAHIQITDASGWSFRLRSNLSGNFYSAESVAFPLQVCAEKGGATHCMEDPVQSGACNACHTVPPTGEAPGRIAVP